MDKASRPVRNRRHSRRAWPSGDFHRPQKRLFTPEIKRMLKDWLVRRRDNPYPSREEKKSLAIKTGLTYIQICNWFANWRRKLKNAGCEPQKKTWGHLIKNYNTSANGNVEQFSICSNDSIWGDDERSISNAGGGHSLYDSHHLHHHLHHHHYDDSHQQIIMRNSLSPTTISMQPPPPLPTSLTQSPLPLTTKMLPPPPSSSEYSTAGFGIVSGSNGIPNCHYQHHHRSHHQYNIPSPYINNNNNNNNNNSSTRNTTEYYDKYGEFVIKKIVNTVDNDNSHINNNHLQSNQTNLTIKNDKNGKNHQFYHYFLGKTKNTITDEICLPSINDDIRYGQVNSHDSEQCFQISSTTNHNICNKMSNTNNNNNNILTTPINNGSINYIRNNAHHNNDPTKNQQKPNASSSSLSSSSTSSSPSPCPSSHSPPTTIINAKYKNNIMEKYLRGLDNNSKAGQKIDNDNENYLENCNNNNSNNNNNNNNSGVSADEGMALSKWIESAAKFTPKKNNYIEWVGDSLVRSKTHNGNIGTISMGTCNKLAVNKQYDINGGGDGSDGGSSEDALSQQHQKEELEAAEVLTSLAGNFRNRMSSYRQSTRDFYKI